jgi:hypothetical protein
MLKNSKKNKSPSRLFRAKVNTASRIITPKFLNIWDKAYHIT